MPEKSILIVDYQNRIVWFDGSITHRIAIKFGNIIKKLNEKQIAPITFYIRGLGGNPWSMISMFNDIMQSPSPIGCVAHDYVASACFTLTQAGVWRAALPGTKFLFHSADGFSRATKRNIQQTQQEISDWLERLKLADLMQFFYFSLRGRPVQAIHEMLKANMALSLPRAIQFFLVDKYFNRKDFLQDRQLIRKIQN